jgi:hypothetical protein
MCGGGHREGDKNGLSDQDQRGEPGELGPSLLSVLGFHCCPAGLPEQPVTPHPEHGCSWPTGLLPIAWKKGSFLKTSALHLSGTCHNMLNLLDAGILVPPARKLS